MEKDVDYRCELPFDDESESFTNGFEAGMMYAAMQRGELCIAQTIHEANRLLFERMAGLEGYDVETTPITGYEGEWTQITVRKKDPFDLFRTS